MGGPGIVTFETGNGFFKIVAVVDMKVAKGSEGFKIDDLTSLFALLLGCYSGGKVFGGYKGLSGLEKVCCQLLEIKPVVALPALAFQTVIDVKTVNVDYYPFLFHLILPIFVNFTHFTLLS